MFKNELGLISELKEAIKDCVASGEGVVTVVENGLDGAEGGTGEGVVTVVENGFENECCPGNRLDETEGVIGLGNVLSVLAKGFLKSFDCTEAGTTPPPEEVQVNKRNSIILSQCQRIITNI